MYLYTLKRNGGNKMEIKSNTIGKLNKIRNGQVFTEPLTFIKEFIQNCQRSKANTLNINIEDNYIEFIDDGKGCKRPSNVFTLDLSSWDSTTEGFGIGFWSCLNIPALTKIEVLSYDWRGTVDVEKLFENSDLTVDLERNLPEIAGFKVRLYSTYFKEQESQIKDYTRDVAKYIESLNVSINEDFYIDRISIIKEFNPGTYCKIYDNRIFTAKITYSSDKYDSVKTFYEKRSITDYYEVGYISGVLEFKPGHITLKEPDRTSFIRNDDYYAFKKKLMDCAKDFYKSYIVNFGIDNQETIDGIARHLSVKDFEKYLELDLSSDTIKKKPTIDINNVEVVKEESEQETLSAKTVTEETKTVNINRNDYSNPNITTVNVFAVPTSTSRKKAPKKNNLSKLMPQLKKSVWVGKDEMEMYKDLIAKAEYCNIKVIIAKNRLYEIALSHRMITHISDINSCLREEITRKDIELKNTKEEAFIKMLNPICEHFNLPLDVFRIANLEKVTTFEVNGRTYYKEVCKNKKDDIKTYGLTDGIHIYLDRKALNLSKYNIHEGKMGIYEIKALANCVNTIAHEMAHYLFNTTDNTVNHYNKEVSLQEEILKLYL